MKIYSQKKISTNYLNVDPGITLSNLLQVSNLSIVKPIPCLKTNRLHYLISLQKTSKPDASDLLPLPWHPLSSSLKRKMDDSVPHKIIINSMMLRSKIAILSPSLENWSIRCQSAKIFTKIYVRWGYNNIRIKEGDEWKAAFCTNQGLYEPTVMFFGLTNSPAMFQNFMDHIFKDLVHQGVVTVYMDDILIFTNNVEEHIQVTREVLKILHDNNLFSFEPMRLPC